MKRKSYFVKGTPVVPSFCAIVMCALWYLNLATVNGKWNLEMNSFSFEGLTGFDVFARITTLAIPLVYFVAVLFLAEIELRWVTFGMILPVVLQVVYFVVYLRQEQDYFFDNPLSFLIPFLVLILYVLTVEGILPTKWILVGFCGACTLFPLVLTAFSVGEFFYSMQNFNMATYQIETYDVQFWSAALSLALYSLGIGALAVKMKVRTSDEDAEPAEAEDSESAETFPNSGCPEEACERSDENRDQDESDQSEEA